MSGPGPALLLAVAVAIALLLGARRRRERGRKFQAFAEQSGFRPVDESNPFSGVRPEPPRAQPHRAALGPVRVGKARLAPHLLLGIASGRGTLRNVFRGATAAGETVLFDYRAPEDTDGQGGGFVTLVAFHVPGVPVFQLMPRSRVTLGVPNVEFEARPGFSRRFTLVGDDEAAVRSYFDGPLLQACEDLAGTEGWHVSGGSQWLVFGHDLVAASGLAAFVASSAGVALVAAKRGSREP